MSHSNSSIGCFASCMAKYKQRYILNNEPIGPVSSHLIFGTMAHNVLHVAGLRRDEQRDAVSVDEYTKVIPSEVNYIELKNEFQIDSWQRYFLPIIKKTAEYEQEIIDELFELGDTNITIEREVKLQLTVEELQKLGYDVRQPLVGIIDVLIKGDKYAVILDYKFSTKKKTQNDFDMNSQLYLYSLLVNKIYGTQLRNIQYGYIDIPKSSFDKPTVLSNGTLSRSKSQNVSQDFYEKCVIAVHGDHPYYNCDPGGYYYDCWCNLAHNKCAYLSKQWLDEDIYKGTIKELLSTAQLIDYMTENNMHFAGKFDSYSCQSCEYLDYCKPWLNKIF